MEGIEPSTKEALHSHVHVRPDLTVSGRRSSKDWAMSEYAPLTQSVKVTFMGTFGTETPSATVVAMDSMFVNEIVLPLFASSIHRASRNVMLTRLMRLLTLRQEASEEAAREVSVDWQPEDTDCAEASCEPAMGRGRRFS